MQSETNDYSEIFKDDENYEDEVLMISSINCIVKMLSQGLLSYIYSYFIYTHATFNP